MWTLQIWFRTALQWKSSLSFTGLYCFFLSLGQCKMQTVDWLWTIVFRVRKQWDHCCHKLICMVKSIVHSLHFTLTALSLCMYVINQQSPKWFCQKVPFKANEAVFWSLHICGHTVPKLSKTVTHCKQQV